MKYQEILDRLEEMHDESAKEFLGSNETDLDFKEKVARWIESLVKESDSLPIVSGSCSNLIKDIENLPRYDIWGTETEGSAEIHYSNDGGCVDAHDLYDILKNYL